MSSSDLTNIYNNLKLRTTNNKISNKKIFKDISSTPNILTDINHNFPSQTQRRKNFHDNNNGKKSQNQLNSLYYNQIKNSEIDIRRTQKLIPKIYISKKDNYSERAAQESKYSDGNSQLKNIDNISGLMSLEKLNRIIYVNQANETNEKIEQNEQTDRTDIDNDFVTSIYFNTENTTRQKHLIHKSEDGREIYSVREKDDNKKEPFQKYGKTERLENKEKNEENYNIYINISNNDNTYHKNNYYYDCNSVRSRNSNSVKLSRKINRNTEANNKANNFSKYSYLLQQTNKYNNITPNNLSTTTRANESKPRITSINSFGDLQDKNNNIFHKRHISQYSNICPNYLSIKKNIGNIDTTSKISQKNLRQTENANTFNKAYLKVNLNTPKDGPKISKNITFIHIPNNIQTMDKKLEQKIKEIRENRIKHLKDKDKEQYELNATTLNARKRYSISHISDEIIDNNNSIDLKKINRVGGIFNFNCVNSPEELHFLYISMLKNGRMTSGKF